MKCIDHEDAVNVKIEKLAKDCIAIVGQFEEPGFLGYSTVFCHVSVPDQAVEVIERTTGWPKIATNTFLVDTDKSQVETMLEKIQLAD